MHVISDLGGPGGVPARLPGTRLVASIDVEWSKNYRIKNGNQAFCYSIVWLTVPTGDGSPLLLATGSLPVAYTSLYLDGDAERGDLVAAAAADIAAATEAADLITGHQLCSDLAVLAANAGPRPQPRSSRHGRRGTTGAPTRRGRCSTPASTPTTCCSAAPAGWSTCAANSTST